MNKDLQSIEEQVDSADDISSTVISRIAEACFSIGFDAVDTNKGVKDINGKGFKNDVETTKIGIPFQQQFGRS